MKYLRNRIFARSIAFFFLISILQSTFLVSYSWALTSGPHQPEYTSYEEPGSTDMVNLLTGDFTTSLPILEVPGPEGGFSLPLTYNSGIGLEQEASWVGLGWTLNAGAITRSINEYPDDANGEAHSINVKNLVGVRGWSSAALGLGQIGWNSSEGHYGSLSLLGLLEASYKENGVKSVGIVGFTFSGEGIKADPNKIGMAVITIASYGTAGAFSSVAKQVALQMSVNAAASAIAQSTTPSSPVGGNWEYSKTVKKELFHKNYWIWLDDTRTEKMYGTLFLGNAKLQTATVPNFAFRVNFYGNSSFVPYGYSKANNVGSASDVNQYINEGKKYFEIDNPAVVATDNFSVKAPGISGAIAPYRLDMGSLSMPRDMSEKHNRFSVMSYLTNHKVPFVYEGTTAGNYNYHVGGEYAATNPEFYFGATQSTSWDPLFGYLVLDLNIRDVIYGNRTRPDLYPNYKISTGNHVEWLSNSDINNESIRSSLGFMDFLPASERSLFRQNFDMIYEANRVYSTMNSFASTIPVNAYDINSIAAGDVVDLTITVHESGLTNYYQYGYITIDAVSNGNVTINSPLLSSFYGKNVDVEIILRKTRKSPDAIGGYVITATNGMNYHFALPIYDYEQKTVIKDKSDPNNKNTTLNRVGAFANTWVLTAITGPDFIDRGSQGVANGIVDDNDWGYWVKFNYGHQTDDYKWRFPFQGDQRNAENTSDSFTEGRKQQYYLNSIETRSHVALFVKGDRADGKSTNGITSLQLNEISLLKKENYKAMVNNYGVADFSLNANTLCTSQTLVGNAKSYVDQYALKRTVFTYDNSLCPNTPNSIAAGGGKLTLKRISLLGRNLSKIVPDYIFTYGSNPSFNSNNWDGWGMFKSNGTPLNHTASSLGADGASWSLTKIATPLGSDIEIFYERDSYSSVSGQAVFGNSFSFSESRSQSPNEGFNTFTIIHGGYFNVGDKIRVDGTWSYNCPTNNQEYSDTSFADASITSINGNVITINSNTGQGYQCLDNGSVNINFSGTIKKIETKKLGGDVRVSQLMLTGDNKQYKTRYLYNSEDGISSSGVVAQEPVYINKQNFDFYNLPGYPITPVIYGRVTILNGLLSDDNDWVTKSVYKFETPQTSNFNYVRESPNDKLSIGSGIYWTLSHHKIQNYTSKIGRLNEIEMYDPIGLRSNTQMSYTDQILNPGGVNAFQGIYSSGGIICESVTNNSKSYYRYSKTTVLSYPNVLKKIITTKDGLSSESENLEWDFLSGAVTEKIVRSSLGVNVKTVTRPAYLEYPEMGSKALNSTNKNMLSQLAATYVYKTDVQGNPIGLISAEAQTWNKDWQTYRSVNSGTYSDSDDGASTNGQQVWRMQRSYSWLGDYARLQSSGGKQDGILTFETGDEFNFASNATNPGWKEVGSIKRYDHYSMPLETVDMDQLSSTTKMGYNDQMKIAEASNASYSEMAFSGAEDMNTATNFFGGEVALGSGTVTSTVFHTGSSALQLSNGYGFVFKPSGMSNRMYRASVWSNSSGGRIYYKINNTEFVSSVPAQQVGSWYQINFEIPTGVSEVGVKSASGTVVFDDFRFQPINSQLTAYVYKQATGELEFVLDNNNLFTKYEYNDRGQLIKTYQESFKNNGVKLVSESKDNYRRFHVNQ